MKPWVTPTILMLAMSAGVLRAEEAEPAESEPQPQTSQAEPSKTRPATSPDIFIPTEEISEDFAVPFPVDI